MAALGADGEGSQAISPGPDDISREAVIVALDFPSSAKALTFLDLLESPEPLESPSGLPLRLWVKVGLELYLSTGGEIIAALHQRGYQVFLDLKLHDIPNTVASAVRALAAYSPEMLTVHASGGAPMMAAAVEASAAWMHPPRLLAVTVLTSMDASQLEATGVTRPPTEQALHLARLAYGAGVQGLVASAQDARALRAALPASHLVTPGIRSSGAARGDQQRVATVAEALHAGANQLVIGRPITQASDPRAALDAILNEVRAAGSGRSARPG